MCTYKSFCWKIGTTSFRTSDFNLKIERQLELLSSFREANPYEQWERNSAFQERYYDFLKENGFLSGDAPRKDKDARQKTSGLCDIGLVTAERRLTPAGERLLSVATGGDFGTDGNILQLPADSFLYFKQLLKTCVTVEGSMVRPYVVLALMLDELGSLSFEEFTYLLPLVTSAARMRQITEGIKRLRRGEMTVDTVIVDTLMSMNNYREALDEFLSRPVSEELVCKVCINRKSARYDKPYYSLFLALQNLRRDDADSLVALFKACRKINIGSWWKSYLFDANTESAIRKDPLHALKDVPILDCEDEREFRKTFFRLVHLFKAKATLYDYRDLNRRYFNITDTVMFADGKAELTLLAKCFVSLCSDGLRNIAFTRSTMLDQDCALGNIIPVYAVTDDSLRRKLSTDYGIEAAGPGEVQGIIERERRSRFDRLVDTMFPDSVLLELLDDFEQRNDDDIRRKVCDNADVPTIFEYIVGVVWYKISNRRGDILSALNLSLDADLLPRTHAAGGGEDITYSYSACDDYPAHTLLIEVTLADNANQRRMEMEPVSRHLGEYMLHHPGEEAYAMFVTTFLHINVLADFRVRKRTWYYSSDGNSHIEGMKIIPVQTDVLKAMLQRQMRYPAIYAAFAEAHECDAEPKEWYAGCIENKFK